MDSLIQSTSANASTAPLPTTNNTQPANTMTAGQQHSELTTTTQLQQPGVEGLAPTNPTMVTAIQQQQPSIQSAASAPPPFLGHIEVKLFVGRLPTSSTEDSIRPLFAEFGDVVEVVIIRDKATGAHKGSAFIRMASITQADAAIRALHNTNVVDPALGPLQISYATGEAERLGFTPGSITPGEDEAKLFVGSLPRDVTEQDVEQFFSKYGKAFDAYLMRDPTTRRFKGCGFVKFAYKEEALVAIKQLHNIVTFPGASRPLEVRIAEPKRSTTTPMTVGGAVGKPGQPQQQGGMRQQQRGSFIQQQQVQQPSNANPRSAGPWKEYFASDGRPYYHNDQLGLTQWEMPPEFLTLQQQQPRGGQAADAGDVTGPPGANIFIFHVPNEWGKEDLAAHFAPFGYILSAKVAVDHTTGRNKGYGFVSYDNVRSALQAVQQMNLMAVKNKRLRVAIKNGEEEHARLYAEQHGIGTYPPLATAANTASASTMNANPMLNLTGYPQQLRGGLQAALAQQANVGGGAPGLNASTATQMLMTGGQRPSGIPGLTGHHTTASELMNAAANPLTGFNPMNAFVGAPRYSHY